MSILYIKTERGIGFYAILTFFFILLAGCGKQDEPVHRDDHVCADITVITPLSGLGDNGYNDESVAGVLDMATASGLEVSLLRPKSLEQAGEYARAWSEHASAKRRLLVLADAEYSSILPQLQTSGIKDVLLYEHDGNNMPADVATFHISRYGSGYLAGCLAKDSPVAHIIQGKDGDRISQEAVEGFTQGYEDSCADGKIVVHTLSDTFAGWMMPDSAYRIAARNPDDFYFPVARGSNAGIYKFSREADFVLMLIAGMDVDCSLFSKRVPFSVVVDVRSVVRDYIRRWIDGEDISGQRRYGLEEGTASIRLSELFYTINDIWDQYYLDPNYWRDIHDANYHRAMRKEAEYEATH